MQETREKLERLLAEANERQIRLILAYARGLMKNYNKDQQKM